MRLYRSSDEISWNDNGICILDFPVLPLQLPGGFLKSLEERGQRGFEAHLAVKDPTHLPIVHDRKFVHSEHALAGGALEGILRGVLVTIYGAVPGAYGAGRRAIEGCRHPIDALTPAAVPAA